MALPIRNGTKIIGAIIFYSGDKTFDAEEIALLERQQMTFHCFGITDKGKEKTEEAIYDRKKISCTDRGSPVVFGQMKQVTLLC
jgi:hypothetical protein